MSQSFTFGVAILAAGASSRMGRPKLLLRWEDTTVLGRLVNQWRQLGARQIAVVIASEASPLISELDRLGISERDRIPNPNPAEGMFGSIRRAAAWSGWHGELSRWVLVLGDQPAIATATLARLLAFADDNPGRICQPSFGGRPKHPVIVPSSDISELAAEPPESTLREWLVRNASRRRSLPVDDPGLTEDLDTPDDYVRAARRWGAAAEEDRRGS